ncbi:hypothetical protein ACWZEH_00005 [Streptomyces sp. QTS137]
MSEVVVGRRTTGRALLKTPQGRALLSESSRGQVQGLFDFGTVVGIIDLVAGLVGAGTGPDMDIEDLLANHSEMLGAILAGQGDLLTGIGGSPGKSAESPIRWTRSPT